MNNQRTDTGQRLISIDDNNSNENRNKSCCDHDITMAGAYNNRILAKLATYSDTYRGWSTI